MADKPTDVTSQRNQQMTRRQQASTSPFRALERFADEVDRMFSDFGFGAFGRPFGRSAAESDLMWTPQIEVSQRNNELVVRADLPGLTKDDVKVDVTDDAIVIQGERRREQEEERGGVFRSERSYGSFYRAVPLPEGAIADQAKATFKDGVLEITLPAPPEQVTRGRRIEITDASGSSSREK
jgi:HSP20 family protein